MNIARIKKNNLDKITKMFGVTGDSLEGIDYSLILDMKKFW